MVMQDWEALLAHLASLPKLALAYSGGLDSRFLAHAAQTAGCDLVLLHAQGAHMPRRESLYARHWAEARGLPLRVRPVNVLELDTVRNNSPERCYHCKKHLLTALRAMAEAEGRTLCDGTNADDTRTHRPGLRALKEEQVLSPLAALGLGKERLRHVGRLTGLENAEQKARPCLLTRLAYGMCADAALLARIEAAEGALEEMGLTDFRLRITPAPVLQTLPLEAFVPARAAVVTVLAQHGFADAEIREESTISGFFDRLT